MRVLIVDDDASARAVLQAQFERRGHDVATASSVIEAVKVLSESARFSVIVSERNLGYGMTGLDFHRLIKPGHYGKRFILFTSNIDDLPRGCPPIVEKPHFDKLITAVEGLKSNG